MKANFDVLDRFVPGAVPKPVLASAPTPYTLPKGFQCGTFHVLGIDQSLKHSGFGLVQVIQGDVREDGSIPVVDSKVLWTGDFKQELSGNEGFDGNWGMGLELESRLRQIVGERLPNQIVHEYPAVMGHNVASSLMASMVVRSVANDLGIPIVAVGSQHAKKLITGNSKASKAEVKTAVLELHAEARTLRPMNTNVSDAIAVALTWLLDPK